jgi:hypothetical protein
MEFTSKKCKSATIQKRDNYILIRYNDMAVVGIKKVADLAIELCNNVAMPFIINGLDITVRMNDDARKFIASYPPYLKIRKAQVFLINNTPSRLLAKFFIQFHKPVNPVKICKSFAEAEEWLSSLPK